MSGLDHVDWLPPSLMRSAGGEAHYIATEELCYGYARRPRLDRQAGCLESLPIL